MYVRAAIFLFGSLRFGYLAALAGAFLIGFSPIFVRLSELGPVATGLYRMLFVIPLFMLLILREKGQQGTGLSSRNKMSSLTSARANAPHGSAQRAKSLLQPKKGPTTSLFKKGYLLWFAALGLTFALNQILWNISLFYTSVAYSTLFANLAAIFILPLGWLLFRLRVSRSFVFCALGAFAGVVLLIGIGPDDGQHLFGNLLAIGAAFFYASYQLIVNQLRSRFSVAEVMLWTAILTALTLMPVVFLLGEDLLIATFYGLAILLALSLLCHGLGQGLISYSLGHIPPSLVSLTLLVQPVTAAVLGWLLFTEVLTLLQIFGIGVTLVFLYLAKRVSASPLPDAD